jgi:hypothetical protein
MDAHCIICDYAFSAISTSGLYCGRCAVMSWSARQRILSERALTESNHRLAEAISRLAQAIELQQEGIPR